MDIEIMIKIRKYGKYSVVRRYFGILAICSHINL